MKQYILAVFSLFPGISTYAGEADVLDVNTICDASRNCVFTVTVKHDDQGWKHYANKWEIFDPAGNLIATRVLAHPHTEEQPFTRSLRSVVIPTSINQVTLRAHDSVHAYGGKEFVLRIHGK